MDSAGPRKGPWGGEVTCTTWRLRAEHRPAEFETSPPEPQSREVWGLNPSELARVWGWGWGPGE